MKTDLFQFCGPRWVFQIFWYIECSTFTASSFRIWNSSTGIPSPPLALFAMMLHKVHLILHSRMSGSGWVITPSWLSESWRPFLYSSSVYSCYLLISSASVRSIPFLSFIVPIFGWNVPLVSLIFLRSLVFPILLFSSISLHWLLKKAFLSLLAILWNSEFKWEYLSFLLLPYLLFLVLFAFLSTLQHCITVGIPYSSSHHVCILDWRERTKEPLALYATTQICFFCLTDQKVTWAPHLQSVDCNSNKRKWNCL